MTWMGFAWWVLGVFCVGFCVGAFFLVCGRVASGYLPKPDTDASVFFILNVIAFNDHSRPVSVPVF